MSHQVAFVPFGWLGMLCSLWRIRRILCLQDHANRSVIAGDEFDAGQGQGLGHLVERGASAVGQCPFHAQQRRHRDARGLEQVLPAPAQHRTRGADLSSVDHGRLLLFARSW